MLKRYQGENLYRTTINAKILAIGSSGNPLDEFSISVSVAPKNTKGRVIVEFTDSARRDLIYFHSRIGTTLKYYRKNRDILGIGAIDKPHDKNSPIQINDVAEWINYLFTNTDDFGFVEDMGTNKVQIMGGKVYMNKTLSTISDSLVTLTDGTRYAVLDGIDTSLKCVVSLGENQIRLATIVVTAGDITSITDDRGLNSFPNKNVLDGLTDVGGNLVYNGLPLGGGSGTGDVVGPNSSIVGHIVIMNALTGKVIADSGIGISTTLNDTDEEVTTSKGVKTYVATQRQEIVDYVDNTNSALVSEDYLAGENILKGDSLFPESYDAISIGSPVTDTNTQSSWITISGQTGLLGMRITIKNSLILNNVIKKSTSGATRCIVRDATGSVIATASFSANTATFSGVYLMVNGTYRIECDNNGVSYTAAYDTSVEASYGTNISFVNGSSEGGDISYAYNIDTINSTSIGNIDISNIGDTIDNSRVAIRFVGSGNSSNSVTLGLAKVGSPTASIKGQIQQEINGLPNGIIFGNEMSNTPANIDANISSKSLSFSSTTEDFNNTDAFLSNGSVVQKTGIKILIEESKGLTSITKHSSCTATKCYIYGLLGNLVTSATFVGDVATLNVSVISGEYYYIVLDNNGSTYTDLLGNNSSILDLDGIQYLGGANLWSNGNYSIDYTASSGSGTTDPTYTIGRDFTVKGSCYLNKITMGTSKDNGVRYLKKNGVLYATSDTQGNLTNVLLEVGNTYTAYANSSSKSTNITSITPNGIIATATQGTGCSGVTNFSMDVVGILGTETYRHNIAKITLDDGIPTLRGQAYRLILYAGNYGSETIDNANYYKLAYNRSKNTTTRYGKIYNGTSYVDTKISSSQANASSYSSYSGTTTSLSASFTPIYDVYITTISFLNATSITITGGTINKTISGSGTFTVNDYFEKNKIYYVSLSGSNLAYGSLGGSTIYNIIITPGNGMSLTINASTLSVPLGFFPYISSGLIENTVLSKTDARYLYKLPDMLRISTKNYITGDLVRYEFDGISKLFTNLTIAASYYVSNIPGLISVSVGTITYKIGEGKSNNKLLYTGEERAVPSSDISSGVAETKTLLYSNEKIYSYNIKYNGTYKVTFTLYAYGSSNQGTTYGRIYKNGATYGTARSISSYGGSTTFSEDLSFSKGDILEFYGYISTQGSGNVSNFYIGYNIAKTPVSFIYHTQ